MGPGSTGYDAELQRHNRALRRAVGVRSHDHVLDIGCGTGQTARQAARAAAAGSAFGVDVSAPAVERARELARAEGLDNVTFEHADAQDCRFPRGGFDLAISRFGTMFFGDPVAAFANIGRALRPGGRLVMMVWQAQERNEWDVAIRLALAGAADARRVLACGACAGRAPAGPGDHAAGPGDHAAGGGPDPFSLGDPATVRRILGGGGFGAVTFTDVHEPVYYGADVAAALDWVRGFTCTSEALKRLDPVAAARAVGRLRETLAAYARDDGIWFDSHAWIVTARRR